MDNINGWTNDKPVGFIPGGNGFVFVEISTPRQLGCVYMAIYLFAIINTYHLHIEL